MSYERLPQYNSAFAIKKITPEVVQNSDLLQILLKHADHDGNGFFKLRKPLRVFKVTKIDESREQKYPNDLAIVNLIIPAGETVFWRVYFHYSNPDSITSRKMRATKAKVHSIVRLSDGKPLEMSYSDHNSSFIYKVGDTVVPWGGFSWEQNACGGGIHFFMNVRDAALYITYQ